MSSRNITGLMIALLMLALLSSCGIPKPFRTVFYPDAGVKLEVASDWLMTIKSADKSAFKSRLEFQPDYVFPPISAEKGDPTEEYTTPIPNWRFIGVKGEFDPEMDPMREPYPQPEGLYYVPGFKGDLQYQQVKDLPWPGAEGTKATVRLYEVTHGLESLGTADIWNAYTVTFNHDGNALEFNFQIPSTIDPNEWIDDFWVSIKRLELS